MSFQATVYNVMVASPGDVEEGAFTAVRDALARWNSMHAKDKGVVLLPISWRTHSSPELGDRPRAVLNKQLISKSDLLIAVFWTRIGTATGEAEGGTVEEIREHLKEGKPVMIYFCQKPASPASFDPEQIQKLRAFQSEEMRGLYATYTQDEELREMVERHLNDKVRDHPHFAHRSASASLLIKNQTVEKALSSKALSFLSMAFSDPTGRLIRLEDREGGLQVGTVQRAAYFREPRDVADAEAVIKELENIGYVEAEGYKRNSFKITKVGFDYLDEMVKNLSADDESQFDTLLELAKTDPRTAIKRSWEALARITFRCLGTESANLDPNSPDCRDMIEHLRKSGRFPERVVREIESLLDDSRRYFTQSEFAGGPPKEDAIQFVFLSAAAARDLLSVLRNPPIAENDQ